MPGYKNIKLTESVRFNGSQVFEINVNKCLNGDMNFIPDDKFYFKVATDDMGKVIGKQGRIAKAIRTVVKAAASKEDKKVVVDIQ